MKARIFVMEEEDCEDCDCDDCEDEE